MLRRPPRSTRTDTLCPSPTLFRSAALEGVQRVDCTDPGEEALVVALLLRRQVEQPGATAALVTPDRNLARRVAVNLQRWSIAVDDSAGRSLADTPPGVFLRSEEHTSELQSLMRISYAVFCLKKKNNTKPT